MNGLNTAVKENNAWLGFFSLCCKRDRLSAYGCRQAGHQSTGKDPRTPIKRMTAHYTNTVQSHFKERSITRNTQGSLMVVKESIAKMWQCEMCIHLINIYSKYVQHKLIEIKEETKKSTIALIDFNTPLSGNNRTSRQNAKEDTDTSGNVINKLDLICMNTAASNCRICIFFKYIGDILHVRTSKWKCAARS